MSNRSLTRFTWCAATLPFVLLASPVAAQSAQASSDQADAGDQLQEILVTAQRRSERLQDVPVAVSAISGERAAAMGVSDTKSLIIAVPALDFNTNGPNGAAPFLRGVGSASALGGQESPVAMFVDGVYIYSPAGNLLSLPYVDRIEVLKGPQGTLFGRNATAGVIQITTRDPGSEPAAEATIGYGNFDTIQGSAYASTPLGSNLSANIMASGSHQGNGWGKNIVSGDDVFRGWNWSVRSKLRWEPSAATRVILSGDYSRRKDDFGVNFTPPVGTIAVDGLGNPGRYRTRISSKDRTDAEDYGVSLKVDQDLGSVKLLSISAYRETKNTSALDQDASSIPLVKIDLHQPSKQFSQELQLQSNGSGPLTWVLGAYYLYGKAAYRPLAVSGLAVDPNGPQITVDQAVNSISGFGQGTYALTDTTHVTVGLRYTRDDYKINGTLQFPGTAASQKDHSSKLTYRFALDQKLATDILVYASHSRGFKSGAFNTLLYTTPSVSPEVLDATEVGLKSEFFDRRVRFNAAAFYYDYSNLQVLQTVPGGAYAINAGRAHIKGIDMDLTVIPVRNLTLSAGMAIMGGHYTSFPNGQLKTPSPGNGNIITPADLAGNDTIRTPDLTFNLGADYAIESAIGKWVISANYAYNDGYYWEPDNRLRQPHYGLLNAGLSWTSVSGNLSARMWAKNLTNAYYYSFGDESPFGDVISPAEPRTYGVTVTVKM